MIKRSMATLLSLIAGAGILVAAAPTAQATGHVCNSGDVCLHSKRYFEGYPFTTAYTLKRYDLHYFFTTSGTKTNLSINNNAASAENNGNPCLGCDQVKMFEHYDGGGWINADMERGEWDAVITTGSPQGSSSHYWV